MSDCQHEWVDVTTHQSGDERVFECLRCNTRRVASEYSASVIGAEQQLGLTNEPIPLEPVGTGHDNLRIVAWDYETTYYHIYATTPILDGVFDPIIIEIPRTAHADADVQAIADPPNRIASRMDPEERWLRGTVKTTIVGLRGTGWRLSGDLPIRSRETLSLTVPDGSPVGCSHARGGHGASFSCWFAS